MSIYNLLNRELKDAIRNNNTNVKNYIRSIKSKISEYCVANNLGRELIEDEVVINVVISHKKSLEKAIELLNDNIKANNLINEYKGEIEFCDRFIPKQDNSKFLELIDNAIIELKTKDVGKIVGFVIKQCKNNNIPIQGSLIKRLVTQKIGE